MSQLNTESSVGRQEEVAHLSGLNLMWVKVKQTDGIYISLKVISCLLAGMFATLTLMKKPMLQNYAADYPSAENKFSYDVLYWLLFIYYSFQMIDELIELYAVYFKREKGALGLLFEMNYFMGVGVAIYLVIFNNSTSVTMPDAYADLQNWINL